MKRLTVGFTYNVVPSDVHGSDEFAEWDSPQTIEAIIVALQGSGNRVIPIEAVKRSGYDVYFQLDKCAKEIDIVFNIAEGLKTPNRESIIPAMLEFLGIPFTGSDTASLSKALNKADTIEILNNYGINTAPHLVFTDARNVRDYARRLDSLLFPLMVKPVAEGTSMGITDDSVVEDLTQLTRAVTRIIAEYGQPALVEEYLDGKEYTVGIFGSNVLPVLELDVGAIPGNPKVRDPEVKEIDGDYSVISEFDERTILLASQAITAHTALSCRHYNRMDFRERNGKTYFLEMNPLPGLNPVSSDLPKQARAAGIRYDALINAILYEAVRDYQRAKSGFSERFSRSRVQYLEDYLTPTLENLSYHTTLPEMNGNGSFKIVRAVQ